MNKAVKLVPVLIKHAPLLVEAIVPENLRNFAMFEKRDKLTLKDERAYLRRLKREGARLFLVLNQDDRVVGTVGLHEIDYFNHTARLGITIFKTEDRFGGYGYSAMLNIVMKAFKEFGLEKLYANVIATNTTQIEWDKRFGFKEEGLLKNEYLRDGQRHDMVRLAIIRNDWLLNP